MSVFEIFRDNKKKEFSETDVAEHYKKMSVRCAVLKWIALIILVIFIVVSVSKHGDDLSFDSVRYIVRYMVDEPILLKENGDGVTFDYNSQNKAYVIGDDFAILGSEGLRIYDYSGKMLFKSDFKYSSPMAVTNGKELIVYDIGGNEVRFYNSYTMLERVTLDSPVYSVSASSSGNYLIQTASHGYRTGFQIYNKNKKMIFRHNFGELTLQSAAISNCGNYAATAAFSMLSNVVSSTISVYDIKQNEPLSKISLEGEYPISISLTRDDLIVFVTDKSVRGYDMDLVPVFTEFYGDKKPQKYKIAEDKVILSLSTSLFNETTEIIVFDQKGENKSSFVVPESVSDFSAGEKCIHILNGDVINTYSLDDFSKVAEYELSGSFSHILKTNSNRFIISKTDEAQIFLYNE